MSRARRLMLVAVAALCLAMTASGTAFASTHLNAYSIEGQFICTGCHEPLNQVNSSEAQAEKTTLQQLVNAGLNLSQIKARMVDYYGEQVLARPPATGVNLLLYILPPLFVVLGLGLLVYNLPKWRARARLAAQAPVVAGPGMADVDAARLSEELERFDA